MMDRLTVTMRCGALVASALSLGLLSGWGVREAVSAEAAPQEAVGITVIQEKTKQGYPYISGGVGTEERELIEKLAKAYNLKLSFADKTGPYLSDVKLVIEEEKGREIVNTTTNGPWFYIQLPEGTYNVKANFKGKTREMTALRLQKDKPIRRTLLWDVAEEISTR